MKEEVRRHRILGGASHTLKDEVMPRWHTVLSNKDLHNRNIVFDQAFLQGSQLEDDLVVAKIYKKIWYDIIAKEDHTCNQSGSKRYSKVCLVI